MPGKNSLHFILGLAVVLLVAGLLVAGLPKDSSSGKNENKSVDFTEDCQERPEAERDTCYYDKAKREISQVPCNEIQNEQRRDKCHAEISYLLQNEDKDVAQCKSQEDQQTQDACFTSLAVNKKDAEVCQNISNDVEADNCYRQVVALTKDANSCVKIKTIPVQDECFFDAATARASTSDCQRISDPLQKDNCLRTIAVNTGNKALCDQIQNENMRDNCKNITGQGGG